MNCKNCKFWDRQIDEKYWRDGKLKEAIIYNCGSCSCPKIDYQIEIKDGDEVSYEDYEGYSASIIMGENFGCIHFKEK